jgi:hypothetical protein
MMVTSNKIIDGWEGKAKGLMQVLWERGFVDVNDVSKYTLNRWQDASGILMKETSLMYLMSNCQDFEDEESLLQTMGREMVDFTPKCHCELAGEGIEYTYNTEDTEVFMMSASVYLCLLQVINQAAAANRNSPC